MAYIATIKVLIDKEGDPVKNTEAIMQGIKYDVIDWSVHDINTVNETINDAIANDTYTLSDGFASYVLVSTNPKRTMEESFWSIEYGWTDYNLATRFDSTVTSIPLTAKEDGAAFVLDQGPEKSMGMARS